MFERASTKDSRADSRGEGKTDFNPKHRIVGAIILVSAAVIILPLLLNKQAPPAHDATQVDATPATKVVIAPIPVAEAPSEPATSPASSPVTTEAPAAPAEPATPPTEARAKEQTSPAAPAKTPGAQPAPPAKTASSAKAANKNTAKTVAKPAAPARLTGWYVQVGTFSNTANARQLADKLKAKGYHVQLQTTESAKTKAVRVRVGPYSENAQAKRAQVDVAKTTGIKGIIGHY